jgi:peptidoglycan-N-acetylglucosamine deacetylase
MARHIVCLTFDFDAMSGFVSRGLTSPTPISRGEFCAVGAGRILDLAKKYKLPTTWFIPGTVIETYPEVCKRVVGEGHEVGHHGWTHDLPTAMTREEEESGLIRGNEAIRKLTGHFAAGYRSPAWDLSPHSIELLLKHGFVYESSMMGDDYTPYYARQGDVIHKSEPMQFGKQTRLIEMPISWSLDDYPHFEFVRTAQTILPGLQNARGVLENWFDDFLYMKNHFEWGVITYTCHPYVIGRGHRMMMLERLVELLRDQGAQFLSMQDAVREFQGQVGTGGLSRKAAAE